MENKTPNKPRSTKGRGNTRKPRESRSKGTKEAKTDLFTLLVRTDLRLICVKELEFCPGRKWRFDYALPEVKIAIEVEGGVFKKRHYQTKDGTFITTTGGRHNSATGFLGDMEKYNSATVLGWRLIRVIPDELITNKTIDLIRQTIKNNYDKETTYIGD